MSSTRLSQTNFQGTASQDHGSDTSAPEQKPLTRHGSDHSVRSYLEAVRAAEAALARPAPQAAARAPADDDEANRPAWQNHFYMAPNVRFTRTPEADIRKQRGEDERPATPPAKPQTPAITAAPAAPANTVPSPEALAAPTPTAPKITPVAAPVARPTVPATATVTAPQLQSVRPAPARPAAPVIAAPVAITPEQVKQPVRIGKWSHLSDHAFFEFSPGILDGVEPAPRVQTPIAPAANIKPEVAIASPVEAIVTKPAPQPVDITTLYRIIECAAAQVPFAAPSEEKPVEAEATQDVAAPQVAEAPSAPVDEATATTPSASGRRIDVTPPVLRAPSLPMTAPLPLASSDCYELPTAEFLQLPPESQGFYMSQERLEQNADLLEGVLEDFGVRGEIIHVRPGPVVTLYEFEPAPGVKSSRVINLADDIARSMSAISARVAVVPGRNVIGIELPNETRETVYFRELIESDGYRDSNYKLALCLGKTIGGESVIAELAKMPHLLVAGTTGSGKSVAINTMILSLLYRLKPEECRLIMVDPKMLELSIYDGIPHLLTPVVTDPKKAVTALKWAVREMEDRYRKMARLGVRNIDGYNQRAAAAREKGETVVMQVETGFDRSTGQPTFEEQEIDLSPMPYIVIIVDEMADLMMVAGKEIEGAIQRLAQMARAAGIHLIMATQRPSVDVITGTIKANFPTRISFAVTSKIDSRTILGEQGAEQLLGQGDMLHTAGGGRIARVHGPFVSDEEVEQVVAFLKTQGRPEYLDNVTADEEEEVQEIDESPVFDKSSMGAEEGDGLFEEAVKVVMRDKKCSTSYIQRRLGVGYNRAASLVERMEQEGLVGAPNHVGKREILMGRRDAPTDVISVE